MNERIRELAEQATSSRIQYDPKTMMTERIQEFDKAKFAELIIRHCPSQVRCTDLLLCNDDDDSEILLQASVQLKRHFGVEE
jgi:hypothetical protein